MCLRHLLTACVWGMGACRDPAFEPEFLEKFVIQPIFERTL